MKARDIEAEFRSRSKGGHGVLALGPADACEMVRLAEKERVKILGIDSFTAAGTSLQPSLDDCVDYSTRPAFHDSDWEEAIGFITKRADSDLLFEVVLGDAITIK